MTTADTKILERAQQWYAKHKCVFLLGKIGQQVGKQYIDDSMGPSVGGWAEATAWMIIGFGSDDDIRQQFKFIHGHTERFSGAWPTEQVYRLEAMD